MVRSSPDPVDSGVPTPSLTPISKLKYEAALGELEQVVQRMEGGQLPLEEAIAAYRRGSELLRRCQQLLSDAEHKIQVLEEGVLRDFDADNGKIQ